jgi:phosphatidate cytidylyltransferase
MAASPPRRPDMENSAPPAAMPRKASELTLRIVFGAILAGIALVTAFLDGWPFALLWTVAAIVLLREWLGVVGVAPGRRWPAWLIGAVGLALAATLAEDAPIARLAPWLCVLVAALGVGLVAAPSDRRLWAGAGVFYASVVAILPIGIRFDPAFGLIAILWIFAVVWLSDIGAYIVGRIVGGPKLWPAVSPGKTWSGFAGGLVLGAGAAILVVEVARRAYGFGWVSGTQLVVLSILGSIVSQGGDLLESAIKRHFGVKDADHIIPGHGGVMDRLDSFWAVCLLIGLLALGTAVAR